MRHPDRINDPHDRAGRLASDRLLGPLDEGDAAWLATHHAACAPCRATADPSPPMRAPAPAPGRGAGRARDLDARVSQPSTGGPPAVRRAGPPHVRVWAPERRARAGKAPQPRIRRARPDAIIAILVVPSPAL